MKNLITLAVFLMLSSVVMAHSGHGDHTAIYASGQSHAAIGIEHWMVVTLIAAIAVSVWHLLRK